MLLEGQIAELEAQRAGLERHDELRGPRPRAPTRLPGPDRNTSRLTREPTAWTRPLQLIVAVGSVLTTIGTAIVLGYVIPEAIAPAFPGLSGDEVDTFLVGRRSSA